MSVCVCMYAVQPLFDCCSVVCKGHLTLWPSDYYVSSTASQIGWLNIVDPMSFIPNVGVGEIDRIRANIWAMELEDSGIQQTPQLQVGEDVFWCETSTAKMLTGETYQSTSELL